MNYVAFTKEESDRIADELPDELATEFRLMLSAAGNIRRVDEDKLKILAEKTSVIMNPLRAIIKMVNDGNGSEVLLHKGCCGD
jgi:hypothetical protein